MNVYLLYPRSSFPDSKERYPDLPFKNGGVAGAIELKRPVGAHCHGARALAREDGVDKLMAKKKLYIASAVCLVFMIGEVIGKNLKENRRSDICISEAVRSSVQLLVHIHTPCRTWPVKYGSPLMAKLSSELPTISSSCQLLKVHGFKFTGGKSASELWE